MRYTTYMFMFLLGCSATPDGGSRGVGGGGGAPVASTTTTTANTGGQPVDAGADAPPDAPTFVVCCGPSCDECASTEACVLGACVPSCDDPKSWDDCNAPCVGKPTYYPCDLCDVIGECWMDKCWPAPGQPIPECSKSWPNP